MTDDNTWPPLQPRDSPGAVRTDWKKKSEVRSIHSHNSFKLSAPSSSPAGEFRNVFAMLRGSSDSHRAMTGWVYPMSHPRVGHVQLTPVPSRLCHRKFKPKSRTPKSRSHCSQVTLNLYGGQKGLCAGPPATASAEAWAISSSGWTGIRHCRTLQPEDQKLRGPQLEAAEGMWPST